MRRAQMHNRDVPVPNKLTAMRDRDRSYGMHRDRLRTIKPAIDNRAPPRRPHIRAKLKRRQLIEGTKRAERWIGARGRPAVCVRPAPRAKRTVRVPTLAGSTRATVRLTQLWYAEWYDRVNRENRLLLERMGA